MGEEGFGNPFYYLETPGLSSILGGRRLTALSAPHFGLHASLLGLDATLGMPGIPQSATGQASIFTGVNAAKYLGFHLNGFPNGRLRRLLAAKGIFRQLQKEGYNTAFTNAYRPPFFDFLRRGLPGNQYSCSTLITYYGRVEFRSLEDLSKERALYMDVTNEMLKQIGFDVKLISPEEGAERLFKISRKYDFCLFEYFLSDLAGHMADRKEAERVVFTLDRFIGKVADLIDPKETVLIVSSDHGNMEDLSNRDHSMNQVPVLIIGDLELRKVLHNHLNDLTDVLPAVRTALKWDLNLQASDN